MRILIGICGIGYGHSIRQSLVIEKLVQRGARIAVFCFGKSLEFMIRYSPHNIPFREVCVPWIYTNRNGIDWEKTEARNLRNLSRKNHLSFQAFNAVTEMLGGVPDVCVSDYEPESAAYAYQHDIPLITIDQQSKFLGYQTEPVAEYNRMEERSRLSYFFPYAEVRYAVSFYAIEAARDEEYDVEIVPAPIRKEIVEMSNRQKHSSKLNNNVLVYFSPYGPMMQDVREVVSILSKFEMFQFIVYNNFGDFASSWAREEHISFKAFDKDTFTQDLLSASCLISTAGHTLLSEAVYLNMPTYTIPLSTYDQHYCARIIDHYQVGMSSSVIAEGQLERFFSNLPIFKGNLTNAAFTAEPEISESILERIHDLALPHSRRWKKGTHDASPQTTRDSQPPRPPLIKDRLFLPDFEAFLADPLPRRVDYKVAVIKPTMKCVCRCIACEGRSKGWWEADAQSMTVSEWQSIFSQLKDCGFEVVQISGGEPLLYPHLAWMVQSIRDHSLVALLNTNGFLLSLDKMKLLRDSGLNGINFSLDSPKPSVHDFLRRRRGLWMRCVDSIRNACVYDDQLWFAIRMVLSSSNLMDLPEMLRLAVDLGASSLKLSYLEWSYQGSPLLPTVETLRRFKEVVLPCCLDMLQSLDIPKIQKETTSTVLKHLLYAERTNSFENYARGIYWNKREYTKHCKIPYSLIIIYGDGRVLPCNVSEYTRVSLPGNLREDRLEGILDSRAMEDFRAKQPDFCLYCPMPLHVTLPLRDTIV